MSTKADAVRFRTICEIPIPSFQLKYTDRFLGLGSCFVENIGQKMIDLGVRGGLNPLGIMYNPISIAEELLILKGDKKLDPDSLFVSNGLFRHWSVHSRWSSSDKSTTLSQINKQQQMGQAQLERCSLLLLSLGSAFVWRRNGVVVSNCHQMPAREFRRELLSVSQMVSKLEDVLLDVVRRNNANVIITVSPVRYLRDGLIGSNRSKSRLLEVAHRLAEGIKQVHYFPAYEIVTDELRDYRFFDVDMAHPSKIAVDYVWQKFVENCCDETMQRFLLQASKIRKMAEHKIQHKQTDSSRAFVRRREQLQREFEVQFPFPEDVDSRP